AKKKIDRVLKSNPIELFWKFNDKVFHDLENDTWFPYNKWKSLAIEQLENEFPSACAINFLLDDGDSRGDAAARSYVQRLTYAHHEANDSEIELIWRYRHEYPEIAKSWFCTYGPEYDEVRTQLGDPVATRRFEYVHWDEDDLELFDLRHWKKLPPERVNTLHEDLNSWAQREHRCSPIDIQKLRIATKLGWSDVFAKLQTNPYLVPSLLTIDDRRDCYDEPGLIMGSELLLLWSACAPSHFLARIIATAANTDLVELAREASRRDMARNPQADKQSMNMAFQVYDTLGEDLENRLAIAWYRCRQHNRILVS
ncbi:MAG: hypothetical protein AAF497_13660, partial [Planctomycetota bacterium]